MGGFVRDLLLGRLSTDFDLVIDGDAIGLSEELASEYGGQVTVHRRFGTAKWSLSAELSLATGLRELDFGFHLAVNPMTNHHNFQMFNPVGSNGIYNAGTLPLIL
ncbi:MAG: hypothetical protein CM1200mP6_05910 [Anaerolineaceae bacterium]|nr:MAG: hypothetical protein CM1200mP6_05910 [Anaerolineaceae bacterium]